MIGESISGYQHLAACASTATGQPKKERVDSLIPETDQIVISHQVLNEVGRNLLKKSGKTESEIREMLQDMADSFIVVPRMIETIMTASHLRQHDQFFLFDGVVDGKGKPTDERTSKRSVADCVGVWPANDVCDARFKAVQELKAQASPLLFVPFKSQLNIELSLFGIAKPHWKRRRRSSCTDCQSRSLTLPSW